MLKDVLSPAAYRQMQLSLLQKKFAGRRFAKYKTDPVSYADEILGVKWWLKQRLIAEALLTPPYRVLVKACHSVGKTHLGGGLVNWWYDCFNPGLVLTTAPTDTGVKDLLWKEVRIQRKGRSGFPGPQITRLEDGPDHWAHGYTAQDVNAFQGRHNEHMLFIFDEAVGINAQFWTGAETMFAGEGHAWLAIFNPTDTGSQAYQESLNNTWHEISISMLEHPNIQAELAGLPPVYPAAIRLERLNSLIEKWCTRVNGHKPTDIEWPPESGQFWRPGPLAESRILGRWPSQATYNIWSDLIWSLTEVPQELPKDMIPEIGCDVARYGDDNTEIHSRVGPCSLAHESYNGWNTVQTAGRLKAAARELAKQFNCDPLAIPIKIDDAGVGGGVVDQAVDYVDGREIIWNFIPVNAASSAYEPEDYPNRRSELWFAAKDQAEDGRLDLTRIPADIRLDLKRQAMGPRWKLNGQGQRVVEPKDDMKKRLGRSPDGMDALNLSYSGYAVGLL